MVDLENKKLIKLMWLPGEEEILFQIENEVPLPLKSKLYNNICKYVDINLWKNLYSAAYDNWLNKDDSSIYDINFEVNQVMINALIEVNEVLKAEIIFYWFDIDRTFNENFKWEFCPMSKKRLKYLGDKYPKINSFISQDYPLVFPSKPA